MNDSLCETCTFSREILTPKRSRFLLCQVSTTDPAFPKYPRQPVLRCRGYQCRNRSEGDSPGPAGEGFAEEDRK